MSAHPPKRQPSDEVLIEVGRAQLLTMEALADLASAFVRLERIVMSVSRKLDAGAKAKAAQP